MLEISDVSFKKHDYSKPLNRKVKNIDDFDPRPPKYKGTVQAQLPDLLHKLKGEQLCISLLFDSKFQQEGCTELPVTYDLPSSSSLHTTIASFKKSLEITSDQARDIEKNTSEQYLSSLWFSARRFRITASLFGNVLSHRPDAPPENLVLRIIQPKNFSTAATQYGLDQEKTAVKAYIDYQLSHGHPEIVVSSSGFMINPKFPFFGATPDGAIYNPNESQHPFGFLEVKCPYSVWSVTPAEACSVPHFLYT